MKQQKGKTKTHEILLKTLTLVSLNGITGHLANLVGHVMHLFRHLGHGSIDLGLVLHEEWTNHTVVDHVGAIP